MLQVVLGGALVFLAGVLMAIRERLRVPLTRSGKPT